MLLRMAQVTPLSVHWNTTATLSVMRRSRQVASEAPCSAIQRRDLDAVKKPQRGAGDLSPIERSVQLASPCEAESTEAETEQREGAGFRNSNGGTHGVY